jgi:hypothetical protein
MKRIKSFDQFINEAVKVGDELSPPSGLSSDWESLLKSLHSVKTKTDQFEKLAKESTKLENYPSWATTLGLEDGKMTWKSPEKGPAWKYYYNRYVDSLPKETKWKEPTSNGLKIEVALVQYAKERGVSKSEWIQQQSRGLDIIIDKTEVEVKSTGEKSPNNQLQTTFPGDKIDAWYMFISNTSKPNHDIIFVNSQILRRALLGEALYSNLKGENVKDLVKNIISEFGLEELLINSIINPDKVGDIKKSFPIGAGAAVNFKVFFSINKIKDLISAAKR